MEAFRVWLVLIPMFNLVCGNVPVLLWESSKTDSVTRFPALSRVSKDEIVQMMRKKMDSVKPTPTVVMFKEQTLSLEDFSWKDSSGQGYFKELQSITEMAPSVNFISSAHEPIKALEELSKHGYTVKSVDSDSAPSADDCNKVIIVDLREPGPDEDRTRLLRSHDSTIAQYIGKLQAKCSNIIGMFSGVQSSWVVREEVRRMRREIENNGTAATASEPASASNSSNLGGKVYTDSQKLALVYSESYPKLKVDKTETILGEKNPTVVSTSYLLTIRSSDSGDRFEGFFQKTLNQWSKPSKNEFVLWPLSLAIIQFIPLTLDAAAEIITFISNRTHPIGVALNISLNRKGGLLLKILLQISSDNSKVGIIKLSVRYNEPGKKITFNFDNNTWFGYWNLKSVAYENSTEPSSVMTLKPSIEIYAPLKQSFHSGTPVKFTNGSVTLEFSTLQLQPFFLKKESSSFDDAVDTVYFFTPAIWSGLFVTFLLVLIFSWGITMIMDIRTMDQFDDPKGKTITVSNTE